MTGTGSRPSTLSDWRWLDRHAGTPATLTQVPRDGLSYRHWVSGELIRFVRED